MTDRAPSLMELHETDRLLDELAARRTPVEATHDPVLALLASMASTLDDRPLPEISVPVNVSGGARGHSRSRHLAAVLAIGITLSSSGLAAAVTGDPLLPIKTVVKGVYDIGHRQSPQESDWILGGRNGDGDLPRHLGGPGLNSHSDGTTRSTDGLHHQHGAPLAIKLRASSPDASNNPGSQPGQVVDPSSPAVDETDPDVTVTTPTTPETPGQSTDPDPTDTGSTDSSTDGTTDNNGKPPVHKPHHANNGNPHPVKPPVTEPDAGTGTTDAADCSTDGSTADTAAEKATPTCPKPHPPHPAPGPRRLAVTEATDVPIIPDVLSPERSAD